MTGWGCSINPVLRQCQKASTTENVDEGRVYTFDIEHRLLARPA